MKNCVTRSERGGHLRLQGTSAEPVGAEEERCASAPKTVTGNSHLTGEASLSSPEVWRFCAAGEAAVAAEAAECPPIPGCEAVCRLSLDPWLRVRRVPERPDRPRPPLSHLLRPHVSFASPSGEPEDSPPSCPTLVLPRTPFLNPLLQAPGAPGREWAAPRRRRLRINSETHGKLLKASFTRSIISHLKHKVTCDFHFSKVLCNVLRGYYKE